MAVIVTLVEYEKCSFKTGSTNRLIDGELQLTESTISKLENINKDKEYVHVGRTFLKPLNHVGVIKVDDLTLEIFPKIFDEANPKHDKRLLAGNLLKMLEIAGELPIRDMDRATLDVQNNDLFEMFIRIFAKDLFKTLRRTQLRNYVSKHDDLRFIRGKIDHKRQSNPARRHVIPCNYNEFSIDNSLNRTLKYTSYLMSRVVSGYETKTMLRSVLDMLDAVSLQHVSVAEVDRISINRLNRMFEDHIRICRIFLSNSTLTLQSGGVDSFTFLVPMEKLFEKFIEGSLKLEPEYYFGADVDVIPQYLLGSLARKNDRDTVFRLYPDITLKRRGKEFAILDMKYKKLNEEKSEQGVSQSDIYQMFAYTNISGAKRGMLLYPSMLGDSEGRYELFDVRSPASSIPLMIRTIDMSIDLCNDWNLFKRNLAEIVKELIFD